VIGEEWQGVKVATPVERCLACEAEKGRTMERFNVETCGR